MRVIHPADILLPQQQDMTAWSVVACDQFTSQPEYWQEAEKRVGAQPSALRLILPEAWLGAPRADHAGEKIADTMEKYLREGVFSVVENSFLYLERTQPDGRVRRGLMGAVDLECYDYASASAAPVRATEGTVEQRLPPRVAVRRLAPLEVPHVMLLMDDREDTVLGPLTGEKAALPALYDFDLMLGGGHIRGWRVQGAAAERTQLALDLLGEPQTQKARYGLEGKAPLSFAVGDGNHSLAAARKLWEEVRKTLTPEEREHHPARYSLVELVNLHEAALDFAPIHRVLFDTDKAAFENEWRAAEKEREGLSFSPYIEWTDAFCRNFLARHGGRLDYIHGDETAKKLGSGENCVCLLMPALDKKELFSSVLRSGPLPRKSFSIGVARDKRYYLECRRIRPEA